MRRRAFVLTFLALPFLLTICGRSRAVEITWGAFCATDYPLWDENDNNLEGQLADSGCAHGPHDLVYLVWDRDVDGIEFFLNCERQLSGDTVVDSSFIGTGILCPSCSTGGFSKYFTWTVTTGDYDTFYVISFNDSTLALATYYGNSTFHTPPVWEVHKDSLNATIACTESQSWATYWGFVWGAAFLGTSIVSGGLQPGQRKVGMEQIDAIVNPGPILWTSMRVDNGPSGGGCTNDSLDIDSVKVYREVTGSGFDPDQDLLIGEAEWGPGPPDGGTATVTFFAPETLTSTWKYYYIAFDISPSANWENCVAACVQDSTYMGVPEHCRNGVFPFCSGDVGLPVEISRFEALPGDRRVMLHWTTESEIDNKGFHIYRSLSMDGIFSKVNEELIPGAGNSHMPLDYEYVDEDLDNGTRYFYKLASVTYGNASSTYEKVVSAVPAREHRRGKHRTGFNGSGANPSVGTVWISYTLAGESGLWTNLEVYDICGRLVETLVNEKQEPGIHQVRWNRKANPSGVYFYRLKAGEFVSTKKMVVVE